MAFPPIFEIWVCPFKNQWLRVFSAVALPKENIQMMLKFTNLHKKGPGILVISTIISLGMCSLPLLFYR